VVSEEPTVGIVIPTYNEERNIERLLSSIQSQKGCSYTVVVVDQGSSDRTAEIARSYGWPVIEIPRSPFYSPPARSRNLGAGSIAGRILLHLDADMELASPGLLEELAVTLDEDHCAAILPEHDVATGFWAKCKALERTCYWGTDMESARGVTRELFVLVGGYDEDVSSGEDFFISTLYRRRTQLARKDALTVHHHIDRVSLRRLLLKKVAYGKSARIYLNKARGAGAGSSAGIVRMSMAAYLKNWRLIFRHPALYLSIFPLRALELAAIQWGSLVAARYQAPLLPDSQVPKRAEPR
jgi:glycosyltransferase involved in cell wall biosynthesis